MRIKDWVELFRQQKSKQFDAYYAFVVSGSIGLVTYWLESGMQETPEELAATAEGIMIDGIKVLFK
ncbi:MAG: TetR-like C-terminal domain-containing protein [Lachnospiraceae bacterium]|nr:TetR-like C-terminal domain-containing protein [Lachnospiraceae bacterium]